MVELVLRPQQEGDHQENWSEDLGLPIWYFTRSGWFYSLMSSVFHSSSLLWVVWFLCYYIYSRLTSVSCYWLNWCAASVFPIISTLGNATCTLSPWHLHLSPSPITNVLTVYFQCHIIAFWQSNNKEPIIIERVLRSHWALQSYRSTCIVWQLCSHILFDLCNFSFSSATGTQHAPE